MKITMRIAIAAVLLAAAAGAYAAPKPRVEVAFVLDTTGSMSGLIEGAKQKIWAIANSVISRKPTPEVRFGLVGYRDLGDEYVTKRFDLTDDIDAVFKNLQSFAADGGGDDEESVNQALREAVRLMSWTGDNKILKIVFLVGDYPPHMNYAGDVKYPEVCKEAMKKGLIINTVQCGDVSTTTTVWREIARLSEGSYVALEQSGNMTVVSTPFDDEIAKTSAELGKTLIAYGDMERQAEARSKTAKAAEAPAAVAADRAMFNLMSGGKAIQGKGDLVSDIEQGTVSMSSLKKNELPPEMQGMSPAEQTAYVTRQRETRKTLNVKLESLASQRQVYVDKELKRLSAEGKGDAFDVKVNEIIAEQAAKNTRER